MDQELISYLDKRFDAIEIDIKGIKEDVKGLKEDVTGLKEDVKGLKEDVTGLKGDVKGLKEDVKELKKDGDETRILLENLQDKVQLVAEGLSAVVEGFKTHRAEVSEEIKGIRVLVQQSYSDLDRRVRVLEAPEIDH